jgi:chromodomain-helicase-DNA-binding protein 7
VFGGLLLYFMIHIVHYCVTGRRSKTKHGKKSRLKFLSDDYVPRDGEIVYGSWARSECFKVERGLLTFG